MRLSSTQNQTSLAFLQNENMAGQATDEKIVSGAYSARNLIYLGKPDFLKDQSQQIQ